MGVSDFEHTETFNFPKMRRGSIRHNIDRYGNDATIVVRKDYQRVTIDEVDQGRTDGCHGLPIYLDAVMLRSSQ